ncbi:hypothetical protein F4775DRAFT_587928 [Biscogniauxia sp. FL1348]|nr:hypothetical protein F4775DRAFT_587928 [Biscogniauxia sp. FL1348]
MHRHGALEVGRRVRVDPLSVEEGPAVVRERPRAMGGVVGAEVLQDAEFSEEVPGAELEGLESAYQFPEDRYFGSDNLDADEIIDINAEPLPRIFDPTLMPSYAWVPKPQLVVYNSEKQVLQLRMRRELAGMLGRGAIDVDHSTVVAYSTWSWKVMGTAAWAVYFGPGSRFNAFGYLDTELIGTWQVDIEGLSRAVDIAVEICAADPSLRKVRIGCSSGYLVKAIGLWMKDWIKGDYLEHAGPKEQLDIFKQFSERLDQIQDREGRGLDIRFWHVSSDDFDKGAKALSRAALEEWSRIHLGNSCN